MEEKVSVRQPREGRAQERPQKRDWKKLIAKAHLHPIMVHFPNALFPVSLTLLGLNYYTGERSFEMASFYTLIFGTLAVPGAIATGLFSWKTRFRGRVTRIFVEKILWSIVLLILSTICILLRSLIPDIATQPTIVGWIYVGLMISLQPLVMRLGFLGGKLVFF